MGPLFGSEMTRRIWADPENVMLIYTGAAAEFALNPENHWLFYTGKLPADPLKRFQETLEYQRKIFFMPASQVAQVARHIRGIHHQVEQKRSQEQGEIRIPDRAFLQVFSMLIEYGIKGREYLDHRTLTAAEREAYFHDMRNFALLMEVEGFPEDYPQYMVLRSRMVARELQVNPHTQGLLFSYHRALGSWRFWVLLQFQARFIDPILVGRLGLAADPFFGFLYRLYPLFRSRKLFDGLVGLFLDDRGLFDLQKPITEME